MDRRPGALPAQALDYATGHVATAAALMAAARRRTEGGVWSAELSLAQNVAMAITTKARHDAHASEAPPSGADATVAVTNFWSKSLRQWDR